MIRGFAILGTLGTNIWIFAHLGDISFISTSNYSEWWSFNDLLRMIVLFFVNGKLLGLLTIMFGVGLEMKYQQSIRKGNAWPGIYLWTVAFLFVEGCIHYILVMEYDILMSYAVTALIISFIVRAGESVINKAMVITGTFHVLMLLSVVIAILLGGIDTTLTNSKTLTSLYQYGSWFEQIQYRLDNFLFYRLESIVIIPMNIFLFLLGVKFMRHGVFSQDENGRHKRKKLFQIGIFIGLPLNLLIFVPGGIFDYPARYLFAPILSLGYIGMWSFFIRFTKLNWLWYRFGEVGKMSLSSYVLQNIIASIIFYGWGLSLGGKLNSIEIISIWIALSCVQLYLAPIIIKHFKYGPMEFIRKHTIQYIVQKQAKHSNHSERY